MLTPSFRDLARTRVLDRRQCLDSHQLVATLAEPADCFAYTHIRDQATTVSQRERSSVGAYRMAQDGKLLRTADHRKRTPRFLRTLVECRRALCFRPNH